MIAPAGSRRARRAALPCGFVMAVAALTGCTSSNTSTGVGASSNPTAAAPTSAPAATATASKGGGSVPTSLSIPSISLKKRVDGLGLAPNGEISPPPGHVQWYNATVSPGQPGISVIAGHVTYNGPDVFANLEKVKVGDTFTIGYANGKSEKFVVTREKSVNKNQLQSDQSVWGQSSVPVTVLITCDAESKLVGAHHVNNFVVWGKPVV